MSEVTFTLNNTTKAKLPRLAFESIKNEVLGETYSLTINFVSKKKIQELNRIYRNINKPTDILSFPLTDAEGEIYINIEETKIEAKKFERSYENFLGFLLIHGCVHLKGYDHGSTMERIEAKHRAVFQI